MPRMMEGTSEVVASAQASPYWAPWKPRKARNTVGKVKAWRLVRIRAKKNSVQTAMKAKTAAAAMPGAASGTATIHIGCQRQGHEGIGDDEPDMGVVEMPATEQEEDREDDRDRRQEAL